MSRILEADLAASIDARELDRVLALLRRVFDIRITFYDAAHVERDGFDIKGRTDYCAARRRDPAFKARCDACDRTHLAEARRLRAPQAYRCHDGLYEAVVPINDRDGHYLGAFMLGQLRPAGEPVRGGPLPRLRAALPAVGRERVDDLATLLHRMADHLLAQQVLVRITRPWAEAAEAHIAANLGRRLTVEGLARAVGRSPSFITHRFRDAFGAPLHRYVSERRLVAARERVLRGDRLADIAGDLGYCDVFHLSRAFTARWKVGPARLKRRV
jgi:AraC-like DNA-binding protein